jgi:hypothetical protein
MDNKYKEPQLMIIEWIDTLGYGRNQFNLKEMYEDTKAINIESIGFGIITEKGISLAGEFHHDDPIDIYRMIVFIPRETVKKITILRKGKNLDLNIFDKNKKEG